MKQHDPAAHVRHGARPADALGEVSAPRRPERRAALELEAEARQAITDGDMRRALTVLMDGFGESIYRFCLGMVADESLARDVHQLTFVRAYEALPSYGGRSTLRTWLYAIARHRALDAIKSRRRLARYFDHETPAREDVASYASPEDEVARGRLVRSLERCLQALTPKVRAAVLLRYRDGLSYEDMADVSSEQPPTLQARVARALPVLRRCMEQLG